MGEMQVTLNDGHGYVFLVAISSAFVLVWAGFKVGSARKKYEIKYPTMYAPETHKNAKEFNCIQRAHQNILENYPVFLLTMFMASLKRPHVAAVLGLIRLLGFIAYAVGYQSGSPAKRQQGAFGYIGLLGLLGICFEICADLILK
mmetsp:Transcript_16097/g.18227  ORF Transcript_16097/g.18227 Transcript_16097/m.18227 type:complete len:145 (+) Transcript_16097:108-542(+)